MSQRPGGSVRVAAVSAQGPLAPAFRVRVLTLREELQGLGVDLAPYPLFDVSGATRFARGGAAVRAITLLHARRDLSRRLGAEQRATVTLVQRQVDMLPVTGLERRATAGRRLVFDVDDAIWFDRLPAAAGHKLAFLKDSSRAARRLAAQAETVVAGNEHLAEWLAPHSRRIEIVPSVIDTRAYVPRRHAEGDRITWAWIGSPSGERQLHAIAHQLRAAAQAAPGREIHLRVLGARAPAVLGIHVDEVPWSEAAERQALAEMDVGLMPLEDNPWTRGKCSYKALQYMAAGVPVLTDDVGVSASVVGHELGGIVVGKRDEWPEALATLSGDAGLRARLGATARSRVEASFSLERWAPVIARILRGDS